MISTFLFSPLLSLSLNSPFPSCLLDFCSSWSSICLCSPLKHVSWCWYPFLLLIVCFMVPPSLIHISPRPSYKIKKKKKKKTKRAEKYGSGFLGKKKRTRSDFWTRLRLLCFSLFWSFRGIIWVFLCVWTSFGDGGHRVNTFYSFYILPIDGMDWCFRFGRLIHNRSACNCYWIEIATSDLCISDQNKYQMSPLVITRQQGINRTVGDTPSTTSRLRKKIKAHTRTISK